MKMIVRRRFIFVFKEKNQKIHVRKNPALSSVCNVHVLVYNKISYRAAYQQATRETVWVKKWSYLDQFSRTYGIIKVCAKIYPYISNFFLFELRLIVKSRAGCLKQRNSFPKSNSEPCSSPEAPNFLDPHPLLRIISTYGV